MLSFVAYYALYMYIVYHAKIIMLLCFSTLQTECSYDGLVYCNNYFNESGRRYDSTAN